MTTNSIGTHIRRFATDALLGLGLFFVTAAMTAGNASFAASELLEEVSEAAGRVADASNPGFLMLALVSSLLFALNMAFFRHIRRSHAHPRSRKA